MWPRNGTGGKPAPREGTERNLDFQTFGLPVMRTCERTARERLKEIREKDMHRKVQILEEHYQRIQDLAEPIEDNFDDVMEKIISNSEKERGDRSPLSDSELTEIYRMSKADPVLSLIVRRKIGNRESWTEPEDRNEPALNGNQHRPEGQNSHGEEEDIPTETAQAEVDPDEPEDGPDEPDGPEPATTEGDGEEEAPHIPENAQEEAPHIPENAQEEAPHIPENAQEEEREEAPETVGTEYHGGGTQDMEQALMEIICTNTGPMDSSEMMRILLERTPGDQEATKEWKNRFHHIKSQRVKAGMLKKTKVEGTAKFVWGATHLGIQEYIANNRKKANQEFVKGESPVTEYIKRIEKTIRRNLTTGMNFSEIARDLVTKAGLNATDRTMKEILQVMEDTHMVQRDGETYRTVVGRRDQPEQQVQAQQKRPPQPAVQTAETGRVAQETEKEDQTEKAKFRRPTLEGVNALGGEASAEQIQEYLNRAMEGTLKPKDRDQVARGITRGTRTARIARDDLTKEGLLVRRGTRKKTWRITQAGREALNVMRREEK